MTKQNFARLAGLAAASTVGVANAVYDTSAVTSSVADIAAVGTAVFAVYVAIKVAKWVRRAL